MMCSKMSPALDQAHGDINQRDYLGAYGTRVRGTIFARILYRPRVITAKISKILTEIKILFKSTCADNIILLFTYELRDHTYWLALV